jgi:hypothetical protein
MDKLPLIRFEVPLKSDAISGAELLRSNKALLIRRAIDPALLRVYGKAWQEHRETFRDAQMRAPDEAKRNRIWNENFHYLHRAADLEKYAFVKALAQSPALAVLRVFFGTDIVVSTWAHLVLPIYMPSGHLRENALPFHQDGGRHDTFAVRAWVLLYPESAEDISAGVQILPTRGSSDILPFETERPTTETFEGLESAHDAVASVEVREAPWTPIVRLGDVLMFSGDCLHRTYIPPHLSTLYAWSSRSHTPLSRLKSRFPRLLRTEAAPNFDRWAAQVTLFPGTRGFIEKADTDYCIIAPDYILFPTNETVETWPGNAPRETPEQKLRARAGFDLVAI